MAAARRARRRGGPEDERRHEDSPEQKQAHPKACGCSRRVHGRDRHHRLLSYLWAAAPRGACRVHVDGRGRTRRWEQGTPRAGVGVQAASVGARAAGVGVRVCIRSSFVEVPALHWHADPCRAVPPPLIIIVG